MDARSAPLSRLSADGAKRAADGGQVVAILVGKVLNDAFLQLVEPNRAVSISNLGIEPAPVPTFPQTPVLTDLLPPLKILKIVIKML